MEFALSEEQAELAGMVRQLLDKKADSVAVRDAMVSEAGFDETLWQLLCEQVGLSALAIDEQYDGAGFSMFESLIVAEELGRSLAPTPLLGTLAATAALAHADDETKTRLLPRVAAGEIVAVGFGEDPTPFASGADLILHVSEAGVDEVTGAEVERLVGMDQTFAFARVSGGDRTRLAGPEGAEAARLAASAAVSALTVGCMQRALDMTVAYSKERIQFGRTIGSFQALKHRMADMLVLVEMSRSASWAASYAVATGASDADQTVAIAASYAGDAARSVTGELIQLHGGIAITWEHDAHLLFKRAAALRQLMGQPAQHRAALAL